VVIWLGLCGQLDVVLSAVEAAFLFWPFWSGHVSWNCMVSTLARQWAEQPRNLGLILNDSKIYFSFFKASGLMVGPTQSSLQYTPEAPLFGWGHKPAWA